MNDESRPDSSPDGFSTRHPMIDGPTDRLAFERVRAALAAHGRTIRQVDGRLAASCPGRGHWRGDKVPSLMVTAGDGKALVHCHAGCHTEDVVGVLGLTMAELYDNPARKRPGYNALRLAIGAAEGFTAAEKFPIMWLLCKARGSDAIIPMRFQPVSLAKLAEATRPVDPKNLMATFKHWEYHGWLSMPCTLPGCFRKGTHPGKGHRPCYFLDRGEDCVEKPCPGRKRGSQTTFKRGSLTPFRKRAGTASKTGSYYAETGQPP